MSGRQTQAMSLAVGSGDLVGALFAQCVQVDRRPRPVGTPGLGNLHQRPVGPVTLNDLSVEAPLVAWHAECDKIVAPHSGARMGDVASQTSTIRVTRATRDLLAEQARREAALGSEREASRIDADNPAAVSELREWEATLEDGLR